jgi:hypothetical protein
MLALIFEAVVDSEVLTSIDGISDIVIRGGLLASIVFLPTLTVFFLMRELKGWLPQTLRSSPLDLADPKNMMYCRSCGIAIAIDSRFCSGCGKDTSTVTTKI